MTERFHRPARMPNQSFDYHQGGEDPAVTSRRAHESANAVLARVRATEDVAVLERMLHHGDEHGLDLLAQLWAEVGAATLPGALWRLYLVRAAIRSDPDGSSLAYRHGERLLATIDPVVAGTPGAAGPDEITALAEEILRGAFRGDFAVALDRAAAYCRVSSAGWVELADAREPAAPDAASALTARAARWDTIAMELDVCARLERREALR